MSERPAQHGVPETSRTHYLTRRRDAKSKKNLEQNPHTSQGVEFSLR
jgi:hypothetical protein